MLQGQFRGSGGWCGSPLEAVQSVPMGSLEETLDLTTGYAVVKT